MTFRSITLAALLLFAAHSAAAQTDGAPASRQGWTLERTMRVFIGDPADSHAFFPARGDWSWVETTRYPDGTTRVGVRRFPAGETVAALEGPVCDELHSADAVKVGTIAEYAHDGRERWRRGGATRFVPPGRRASFPVFVEWRREDGRWVISSLGGGDEYQPKVLGRDAGASMHGARTTPLQLPLPDTARVAAGADWFEANEPVAVGGHWLMKYGLTRTLRPGDGVRWGSQRGVGIYVEPGADDATPEVVYLPLDRAGSFQPYQNMTSNGCDG